MGLKALKARRKPTGVLPLAVLAGVMTGAEALLAVGVELPFAESVPPVLRAIVIVGITAGAFVLRILAQRAAER